VILVDTSVWIDHLRRGNSDLVRLLEVGEVCIHPFVIGELACGTLTNRREVLSLLRALPQTSVALHEQVLAFIEVRKLAGRGLGWIDAHLLASALIDKCDCWTLDRRLSAVAHELKLAPF
jgi:predicted nucleic acid-binding protein